MTLDFLFVIISVFLWAFSAVILETGFKKAGEKTFEYSISGLTFGLASGLIFLSPSLILVGNYQISLLDILLFSLSGFFTYSLGTALYYFSISNFGGTSTPMTRLKPLIVALVAIFIFTETVGNTFWVGVVLLVFGSIVLGFAHGKKEGKGKKAKSFLAYFYLTSLALAVSWTLGEIFTKMALTGVSPILGNYISLVSGFAGLLVYIALKSKLSVVLKIRGKIFFAIHGLLSFALGYTALYFSIEAIGVARTSAITAVWPLLTVLFTLGLKRTKASPVLLLFSSAIMILGALLL